jgi:16S rRNA (cytosine967-C5)-methyltransferase
LKTTAAKLIESLESEGVSASVVSPEHPDTVVLAERKNVFVTKAFHQGMFEVQDWSSQHVAPFLEPAPGMRVVDACAGAGGKSLHLAALMKNKGKIIAMDIHEWKLKELRTRASRDGVDIIEVKVIEGQKSIKRLAETADRLLLDVPCSGVGVLRRNPDSKWKLSAEELQRLNDLQQEILHSYSRIVKPGGQMVYSTCSIFPSENEKQVQRFLENNKDFTLVKQKLFLPQENDWDGFYAALMVRKG